MDKILSVLKDGLLTALLSIPTVKFNSEFPSTNKSQSAIVGGAVLCSPPQKKPVLGLLFELVMLPALEKRAHVL